MSDDPSQVSTATLTASLQRDVGRANALLLEAYRFLEQATATAWELKRRDAERDTKRALDPEAEG